MSVNTISFTKSTFDRNASFLKEVGLNIESYFPEGASDDYILNLVLPEGWQTLVMPDERHKRVIDPDNVHRFNVFFENRYIDVKSQIYPVQEELVSVRITRSVLFKDFPDVTEPSYFSGRAQGDFQSRHFIVIHNNLEAVSPDAAKSYRMMMRNLSDVAATRVLKALNCLMAADWVYSDELLQKVERLCGKPSTDSCGGLFSGLTPSLREKSKREYEKMYANPEEKIAKYKESLKAKYSEGYSTFELFLNTEYANYARWKDVVMSKEDYLEGKTDKLKDEYQRLYASFDLYWDSQKDWYIRSIQPSHGSFEEYWAEEGPKLIKRQEEDIKRKKIELCSDFWRECDRDYYSSLESNSYRVYRRW